MDYSNLTTTIASPRASSMIETFRAIGYNIETAVADIIDNSISANANKIYLDRHWNGGKSTFTIIDDGVGMNGEEIINAMRPGSINPLSDRDENDLGRFGLGLKTASFSQCRKLTVISKKKGFAKVFWTWDLDYVTQTNEWKLLRWIPSGFETLLDDFESGTAVIWTDMDRVIKPNTPTENENARMKFSSQLDKVKQHIAMTFHRFIEEDDLNILWCGHKIDAWNPFCISEGATQPFPSENLIGGVSIKGYVLPHKNNFSNEEAYNRAEGINGWGAQQGFYVYRGKRLLLAGDWLGLFRKEEHYKLARIEIDIPNTLDSDWQIDIKKSKARIPIGMRDNIEAYAKSVRSTAVEVFRHRGRIIRQRAGSEFQPLWITNIKDGKWSFVINRKHQMVKDLIDLSHTEPEKAINSLLKFIESTIPTKSIFIKESESEVDKEESPSEINEDLVYSMVKMIYDNKLSEGLSPDQAKAIIKTIEPFNNYEEIINNL
jgi:hypothetical protein